VLGSVIDLVTDATGGDACVLHLWDAAHDCLVLRAASPPLQSAVGEVRLRLGEGVTGWAAEHRQVVVIPEDKWADPRYRYFPELHGERYTSMISVPLLARSGGLLGVFNVHARERRDYDLDVLKLTASLVAGAIEHADLFQALAEKEAALAGMMRRTIQAQDLGLAPALRALAHRQLTGETTLDLDVADDVALPAHHEVVLYRVAQEAITNICRHAHARRVKIALYEERSHVVLVVGDDGGGFDPAAGRSRMSFGLAGMTERVSLAGGRLSVHSAPGRGTVITVLIPGGEQP
jgi:signal transduction protein with GAF and PtsI domain